jgi:lysophospholipase L1-like esterase
MKPARKKIITILFALVIVCASLIFIVQQNNQKVQVAQIIRVACVGDSITEWSHYPEQLQQMLGDGYLVGNFGVAGSAVTKNSDKPYENQSAFQAAKDFQPSIIIIMLGTNDAKDYNYQNIAHFPNDYEDIIDQYNALPDDQQIFLVVPPPIYNNTLGLNDTNLEQGVIPKITQVADDLNLQTIDVNTPLTDHSDYFNDGVHPNADGAEVIASTISDALTPDMLLAGYLDGAGLSS